MPDLSPGDLAPDFSLPLDDGSTFQLSDQRGRSVVLFFYPQDNTGGCTDENQEFSALASAFDALGSRLVGISPDSIESHLKFRAKHGLSVPLASDSDRQVIEAFGLWKLKKLYGREFMGLIRTTFIIDTEGKVARIIRASKIRGHAQKVLEAVQAHGAGTIAK